MPDDKQTEGMPSWWPQDPSTRAGRFNLAVWGSPRRRWAFLTLMLLLAVGILVWTALDPSDALDGSKGPASLVASLFLVGLFVREVVRALRGRLGSRSAGQAS